MGEGLFPVGGGVSFDEAGVSCSFVGGFASVCEALGGSFGQVFFKIIIPQATPDLSRVVLSLIERILSEATALLVLMGAVMPNQVLATELFRLTWLGRQDAAVLAMGLVLVMILLRVLTALKWRGEREEENCRYNWW